MGWSERLSKPNRGGPSYVYFRFTCRVMRLAVGQPYRLGSVDGGSFNGSGSPSQFKVAPVNPRAHYSCNSPESEAQLYDVT